MNNLPGLALNRDPPDLCLLSSWDYRREPLVPALCFFILDFIEPQKRQSHQWSSNCLPVPLLTHG
jgi:hypothetical protein